MFYLYFYTQILLIIMILIRSIIFVTLCVARTIKSQPQGFVPHAPAPTEDLVDEYYTTILKPNDKYTPQDEKDAQAIMDSDRKEEVIASILPYRDKIRRFFINERMKTKIEAVVSWSSGKQSHSRDYWVSETYYPQDKYNSTNTFMDVCFGLLEDENVVLGQYLKNFFDAMDETWIIIAMVLTKDMGGMISTYNRIHVSVSFKDERKAQRNPFENMLRVWVRHNRDSIEANEPNHDDVVKDANTLKTEYESGDWHKKCRDQLELILMKKSIKYSRAVLAEFEKIMGKKIEDIINDNVNGGCKINHDLADAYASLAIYVKDKYTYIAKILRTYCDGSDRWAAWVMCIAVVHPQEWPKVDVAFQKDNKDDSLSKFILQKLTTDKVLAEMIAVIVDPKFKPTTFAGQPNQGASAPFPTPPPVAPTVAVPAGTTPAPPPTH